nr:hypothetical protein [Agrobacterium vitis]
MNSTLKLYRLVPQAPPGDPNWQNCLLQGEVKVCALSSGDARLVAAEAEGDFMDLPAKPAEDVSTTFASAFLSDKLFTVMLEADTAPEYAKGRGVIEGHVNRLVRALSDKQDHNKENDHGNEHTS